MKPIIQSNPFHTALLFDCHKPHNNLALLTDVSVNKNIEVFENQQPFQEKEREQS